MESLRYRPLFSLAQVKDLRRNIFGLPSLKPWRMPKGGFSTITESDFGGGVEEFHVIVIARVAGSRPNFVLVFPFKPRPTQTERHGKFVQMEYP
jgi:hypothetical protein